MSATGRTSNYGYPLYQVGDSTNWADYNSLAIGADRDIKAAATTSENSSAKVAELTGTVESLQNDVAGNSTEIGELKESNENLLVRVSNNETHINDNNVKIEELSSGQSAQAEQITNISQNITTMGAEVTKNGNDISTLYSRVDNISTIANKASTDVEEIKNRLHVDEESIELLSTTSHEQAAKLITIDNNLKQVNKTVEDNDRELQEQSGTLAGLQADVAELQNSNPIIKMVEATNEVMVGKGPGTEIGVAVQAEKNGQIFALEIMAEVESMNTEVPLSVELSQNQDTWLIGTAAVKGNHTSIKIMILFSNTSDVINFELHTRSADPEPVVKTLEVVSRYKIVATL